MALRHAALGQIAGVEAPKAAVAKASEPDVLRIQAAEGEGGLAVGALLQVLQPP